MNRVSIYCIETFKLCPLLYSATQTVKACQDSKEVARHKLLFTAFTVFVILTQYSHKHLKDGERRELKESIERGGKKICLKAANISGLVQVVIPYHVAVKLLSVLNGKSGCCTA